jgi:hypothetical protein
MLIMVGEYLRYNEHFAVLVHFPSPHLQGGIPACIEDTCSVAPQLINLPCHPAKTSEPIGLVDPASNKGTTSPQS